MLGVGAARVMNKHRVGSLVVIEGGQMLGIFTERDNMRRVIAKRREAIAGLIHLRRDHC